MRYASDEERRAYRVQRDLNIIERTRNLPTNQYVVTRYSYDYEWVGMELGDAYESLLEYGFAIKCLDLVELKWECYLPDPEYDDCSIHLIITEDEVNSLIRKSKDLLEFLSSFDITMMDFSSLEMVNKLMYVCDFFNIVELFDLRGKDAEAIPIDEIKLIDKSTITPLNIKQIKLSKLQIFKLHVKVSRVERAVSGLIKRIRRTLTEELAQDLLAENEYCDYKIKRQFKDSGKEWDISDMNNGVFPFVPQHFDAIKLISSECNSWVIAVLEKIDFYPNSDNTAWIVEFNIGDILKSK